MGSAGAQMEDVWVEKYRPKNLSQVVGQDDIVARLKGYVKVGNLPHLLFAGPAGTGKTTCAIALARELYGESWRQRFLELNASDERGIGVVRTKIKEFARTASMGDQLFKVIFLDEADALTPEAQAALRRTMERYTQTCRFILSCNYSSRIIEPIQSRCSVFRFRPIKQEDMAKHLRNLAVKEGLRLTDDGLEALVYIAEGDLRKAINSLQVAASIGTKVDAETLYKVTSTARPEEVKALIETALGGDFLKARGELDDLLLQYGLSGEDIIRQIHKSMFDTGIPDRLKVQLVDHIGEVEFRMVEGANERIQLEALLAHLVSVGAKMKEAE
jgi:replication factor C small subunit